MIVAIGSFIRTRQSDHFNRKTHRIPGRYQQAGLARVRLSQRGSRRGHEPGPMARGSIPAAWDRNICDDVGNDANARQFFQYALGATAR